MITSLLGWEEISLLQPLSVEFWRLDQWLAQWLEPVVEAKESDWNSGQLINNCSKTSTVRPDWGLYVPSLYHHQKLLARHHHQPSQELLGKVKLHGNNKYVVAIMQSSDWGDSHPCLEHGLFQPVCRHSGCWDLGLTSRSTQGRWGSISWGCITNLKTGNSRPRLYCSNWRRIFKVFIIEMRSMVSY